METTDVYEWHGRTVVDADGDKIGTIAAIYIDQQSDRPEWALVSTGRFGTKSSFVPLAGATPSGEHVCVAVDKARVKDAPRVDTDGELSQEEEAALFRYYDVPYDESGSVTAQGPPGGAPPAGPVGQNITTEESMKEALVDPDRSERGHVRLQRYVVTESAVQTDSPENADVQSQTQQKVQDVKQTALQKKEAVLGKVKQATGSPSGSAQELTTTARENPLPLAVGGALLVGFLLGRRRR